MPFRYEIKTPNYCEAMKFLLEHRCRGGTFTCPDHVFNFKAEFKDKIDDETLDHYNSKEDFSIRRIRI